MGTGDVGEEPGGGEAETLGLGGRGGSGCVQWGPRPELGSLPGRSPGPCTPGTDTWRFSAREVLGQAPSGHRVRDGLQGSRAEQKPVGSTHERNACSLDRVGVRVSWGQSQLWLAAGAKLEEAAGWRRGAGGWGDRRAALTPRGHGSGRRVHGAHGAGTPLVSLPGWSRVLLLSPAPSLCASLFLEVVQRQNVLICLIFRKCCHSSDS